MSMLHPAEGMWLLVALKVSHHKICTVHCLFEVLTQRFSYGWAVTQEQFLGNTGCRQ